MIMSTPLRKFILTSHIIFSVGWLGAVVVFIVFAITGFTTMDNQLSRSSLVAMELSAWLVIVPFCLTSLFTGIVQALFTKWGLLRYYWVIIKLFLTIVMTILLLLHMQPISDLANAAKSPSFNNAQYSTNLISIIAKAGAAILALVITTTLSIYKPWGKIQLNRNSNQSTSIKEKQGYSKTTRLLYALIVLVISIIVLKHLFGG